MLETLTQLVSEVREELGNPLDSEISDASIQSAITKAVNEYSRFKPRKELVTLNIVAGQQTYPLPDDVIRVSDLAYCDMVEWNAHLGDLYPDISKLDNPSLLTMLYQKVEGLSERLGHTWEVIDRNIILSPVPSSSGFLIYVANKAHTLETVPQYHKELLKKFILGECMIRLGRSRNKKITSVPTVNGSIKFDAGKDWRVEGEILKQEFYKELGSNATVVVMG